MYEPNCIFCKIIQGEIPATKLYEDDTFLVFLDIAPVNKGHALIIPKDHHETLSDIPDEKLKDMMILGKKIARALSSALGNDGYNVVMNNKPAAGQVVAHAHLHIIPRYNDDGFPNKWPVTQYKDKEVEEYQEKIKSFL